MMRRCVIAGVLTAVMAAPAAAHMVWLEPDGALDRIAPPRWEKALRTDEAGRVRVALPWAGRYVVEAAHVDETPGGAGETAYDRTRHVATLSFVVASGIPWSAR